MATAPPTDRRRRVGSMEVLLVSLIALAVSAGAISAFVSGNPDLSVAATVFCGVFVQALPFLVLGVVLMLLARWRFPAYFRRRAAPAEQA